MRTRKTLLGLAIAAFCFQLLTLNYPKLSGDEAIYLLLTDEVRRILAGHWPQLNPVIGYSGPLNFWYLGSVYGLTSWISWLKPGPWMVRLPVLLLFWAGLVSVARELGRFKEPEAGEKAEWFLGIGAVAPMTLVFSRVSFPHSVLLGYSLLLLCEALHVRRTGQVRWLRAGIWAACLVDAHPTGYVALAAIALPCLRELGREARRHWPKALACVVLFGLSAYSTLRNYPLPLQGYGHSSFALQMRGVANMNSGIQSYDWWFIQDLAPNALLIAYLLFLAYCMLAQLRGCAKSREPADRRLLWVWGVQLVLTLVIMKMGMNGRHLFVGGCERYLLCLLPGWIWLQSDAFRRFARTFLPTDFARAGLVCLLGIFFLARPVLLTWDLLGDRDPFELDAQWLMKECPKGQCVAFADDFWSYWPIRFYSRDAIDLNFVAYEWKPVTTYPTTGRLIAGCWHMNSRWKPQGPYAHRLTIPAQDLQGAEECFAGVSSVAMAIR